LIQWWIEKFGIKGAEGYVESGVWGGNGVPFGEFFLIYAKIMHFSAKLLLVLKCIHAMGGAPVSGLFAFLPFRPLAFSLPGFFLTGPDIGPVNRS